MRIRQAGVIFILFKKTAPFDTLQHRGQKHRTVERRFVVIFPLTATHIIPPLP